MVVLTGFMGSGKTTVGQQFAELMGWRFLDLDQEIERGEQKKIRDIFSEFGEAEFREIEHKALMKLVSSNLSHVVLAVGGGTLAQPRNEALLKLAGVRTVFLEVPVEVMEQRCCGADHTTQVRPLAVDSERFRTLYQARLPSYRRADVTIQAGGKTPEQVASEIGEALSLVHLDEM